jgi:hypothetical protein
VAPSWGQNLYLEDNEIYIFGRGLPALHLLTFSFSYTHAVIKKKNFENWSFFSLFAPPQRTGVLKFTILVPLVLGVHQNKFEKNSSNGFQEVKNINKLLIYYIYLFTNQGPTKGMGTFKAN